MNNSELWAVTGMVWLLAIAMLMAEISEASAGTWVDINVASKHSESDFNEDNKGLGLSTSIGSTSEASVGFYENSYNKESIYAGVSYHKSLLAYSGASLDLGIAVFAVTGYEDQSGMNVTPMAMPRFTLTRDGARVSLGWLPSSDVQVFTLLLGLRI